MPLKETPKKYRINKKKLRSLRKEDDDLYDIGITSIRAWMGECNAFSMNRDSPNGINVYVPTIQAMDFLLDNKLLEEIK